MGAVGAVGILMLAGAFAQPDIRHHILNWWNYWVADGPYVSRRFADKHVIVAPRSRGFQRMIYASEVEDRSGLYPDFTVPVQKQLTVPSNPAQLARYKAFLNGFFALIEKHGGEPTDGLAADIVAHVHEQLLRNRSRPMIDLAERKSRSEKEKRIEDLAFLFVNYNSACGTISQTLVSLLRQAGFKTRLLRLATLPERIEASHVFAGYYSAELSKWVMIDAQEGFIPRDRSGPLSAFEFFAARDKGSIYGFSDVSGYRYADLPVLWYVKNGPFAYHYYFSSRAGIRARLADHLQ